MEMDNCQESAQLFKESSADWSTAVSGSLMILRYSLTLSATDRRGNYSRCALRDLVVLPEYVVKQMICDCFQRTVYVYASLYAVFVFYLIFNCSFLF